MLKAIINKLILVGICKSRPIMDLIIIVCVKEDYARRDYKSRLTDLQIPTNRMITTLNHLAVNRKRKGLYHIAYPQTFKNPASVILHGIGCHKNSIGNLVNG
jgi:hypothetical protein